MYIVEGVLQMKIVIGGQIDRSEIMELVKQHANDTIEVSMKNDLDAAMALQANEVDYYIGACNTGGGGAIAMAIALVGKDQCSTLSMPGKMMSESEIRQEVMSGKKAFGFTAQDKAHIVPIIIDQLLQK